MNHPSRLFAVGCVLLALAVALGAFGAHGLKPMLVTTGRAETFETAVKYHFYHALGLLALAMWAKNTPVQQQKILMRAGWILLAGVGIFAGSLYLLCIGQITWLGAITPLGGVLMIVGWLYAAWQLVRH
ncbi:MAG: DUF423 domain-containing protein [Cytophagales bacterium]|nr:DUF423 domain-containing protein [Bernardetiaceae bacterium]MDW8211288.1 DUF423 domain-containing protein [Cytophagales bacterium]